MDPPLLPPHPTSIPNPTTANSSTPPLPNYPDSSDSSPRSRDTWDDPLPGVKLRLMCSYGGHVIPRPHDKSLCYVGGDTRMVVVDRLSSLADLSSRLSRTLLHGHHFNLKYKLPNEDLDSLVSVSTDEDLENMIEEYDRTASISPMTTSRLRLFLFLAKPETAASMGCLLNDAKSETWFVDALNGTGLNIPREDVQSSMPDSPMVETNSSFGSSSSSPSMSSLPRIRVRVETNGVRLQDQMAGLDEQLYHMSTSVATNVHNQGDGVVMLSALPPIPVVSSTTVCCANQNRVVSDDERSDQGAPSGFRKPPLPVLQPVPRRLGHDAYNLPSPDSVASDSSIGSASSLSRNVYYQDPTHVPTRENTRPPAPGVVNPNNIISDPNSQISMHQVPEQVYMPPPQQSQQQQPPPPQQYFHPSTHYIHPTATGPVPVPVQSYYPMYAPQAQSPYHQQVDQQYSMYLMPVSQTQPYNMNVQSNATDSNVAASNYQQNPQNPPVVAAKPPLAQVSTNQFQQQYVNLSQIPHPSQSPVPAAGNYGYEYTAHPTHEQVYYTQHPPANLLPPPPQYQTVTPAAAVLLSQASAQQSVDNAQQQMR